MDLTDDKLQLMGRADIYCSTFEYAVFSSGVSMLKYSKLRATEGLCCSRYIMRYAGVPRYTGVLILSFFSH